MLGFNFTPTPYVGWVIIAINKDIPIYIFFRLSSLITIFSQSLLTKSWAIAFSYETSVRTILSGKLILLWIKTLNVNILYKKLDEYLKENKYSDIIERIIITIFYPNQNIFSYKNLDNNSIIMKSIRYD